MKISIGQITTTIQYGFTESATNVPVGPKFLRITDIQNGEVNWDLVPYCKCNDAEKYQLKKGDLVFARTGATTGKSYLIGECPEAVFASYLIRLRVKENVYPKYIYYFFQSEIYWSQIRSGITGSTQGGLNATKLGEFEIFLPDYKLQVEIAETLEQADKARQQRKAASALTDEFLQSSFLSLFGDPVKNEKGWEVKSIGDLIEFMTSGSRGWAEYYSETGDIFLRINNIGYSELRLNDLVYVKAPDTAEAKRTEVKAGDVLFSITADLGRTALIPDNFPKAFINQHLAILRFNRNVIDPLFVSFFFSTKSGRSQIVNKGGVKLGLNFDDIKNLRIYCPPLSLQQQFAAIVAQAEQLRQKQKESEQELEQLFQSLLQKYFG